MLYFTLENSKQSIEAIYNGRTAFILGADEKKARRFLNNESINPNLHHKLYHELCHQNLFLITKSGHLLSGLRFITRFLWNTRLDEKSVALYYKARTVFYMNMRDIHEKIVDEFENSEINNGNLITSKHFDIISEKDAKVIGQWGKSGIIFSPIVNFFLYRLGEFASKNFSIVCGDIVNGKWQEAWVSNGGIINDRETKRPNQGVVVSSLKWITAPFQIENWFKNTINEKIEKDWMWLQVKFKVEFQFTVQKGIWDEASFDSYMFRTLHFAAQWSQLRSHECFLGVASSIRNGVYQNKQQPINHNWLKETTFHKFINFFYLHGN